MKLLNIIFIVSYILFFNMSFGIAEQINTAQLSESETNRLTRLETKIDNLIDTINERFNQVDRRFQDVFSLISENNNICGFDDWQHWIYMPGKAEYKKVPHEPSFDNSRLNQFINDLRIKAKGDPALAEILHKYNLY